MVRFAVYLAQSQDRDERSDRGSRRQRYDHS